MTMKKKNWSRGAALGVLMAALIAGYAWAETITATEETTGGRTAIAVNVNAKRTGDTQTDTARQYITSGEITQELNSTYASYGHSLFQMKDLAIVMQKDDANGAYGATVTSNGRKVILSSEDKSKGTSATTSVSSAAVVDIVTDTNGVKYSVNTSSSGTTFSTLGGTIGYTYTTINGENISTKNVSLISGGTLSAGQVKISSTGINAGSKTITNVANGAIEENSKEAVNGGQIYDIVQGLESMVAGAGSSISALDNNIDVQKDADSNEYKIGLSKNLNMESASFSSESGDRAAVSSSGLTASGNSRSISFTTDGISAGGQKIQNVADGEAPTDAVNVKQLNQEAAARQEADSRLEQRVAEIESGFDGRFDRLDSKIDKVGAGAAALAALHPLDYDPDDKLEFAVGLGNYRSEQAIALGAFYRPNEAVMFSVGGTMGNNDNMVNLGVSFALDGKRGKKKESRAQLEQKVENMSNELAEVKAQLALLLQQNKK